MVWLLGLLEGLIRSLGLIKGLDWSLGLLLYRFGFVTRFTYILVWFVIRFTYRFGLSLGLIIGLVWPPGLLRLGLFGLVT